MKRKLDTLALLVQWGKRFCLLLIFFPLTLRAEADTVVALRNALRDANSDSLRFVLYERLAKAQLDSSFDAASTTFAQWVDLAIKREAFRDAGRAENCWGIEYLPSWRFTAGLSPFLALGTELPRSSRRQRLGSCL